MPTCTNKGCGKSFDEAINSDSACEHHPGAPVFHEGLKSWSCCTKKVTDFDDFLKIPGCAVGRHSIVAAPTPKPAEPSSDASKAAAKPVTVDANGAETYGKATEAHSQSAETPIAKPKADAAPAVKEEDLHDAPDAKVAAGSKCKRNSCGKEWTNDASRSEECVFHSGSAVFHEGSKGWSCCPRKVLEFDEFLKIKGCKTGKHRFTDVQIPGVSEVVQCRHDWYQTPTTVIISIFAKKVDKKETSVVITNDELKIDIKFLDGKVGKFHTALSQPIDPATSKFELLTTKIELVLKKANGINWATIEPNDSVQSWTTFGTAGGVGTVGGKVPLVAGDVDLSLLQKK
ncbi:hypothetical protein HKX48_007086 [Thoreauomyces humboldtii]|nr:hypothetical protein HKX48_007086 [Thoreauomyces humboldtii]